MLVCGGAIGQRSLRGRCPKKLKREAESETKSVLPASLDFYHIYATRPAHLPPGQVVGEKQELIKERENLRCAMEDSRRTSGDLEREKETFKGQMNLANIEKNNLETAKQVIERISGARHL